jgi:hypothetical protein
MKSSKNNVHAPSNVVAGVSRLSKPHSVPPPRLVPDTRSNAPSSSTLIIDTPDPMLTSRHGSCGVGLLSNVTPYLGGSGLGLSSWGIGVAGSTALGVVLEEGVGVGKSEAAEGGRGAEGAEGVGCDTLWISSSEK